MTEPLHPAATHHLPPFVTAPGETDVLFIIMAVFVLFAVIGIGIFYFKIHALPEQMAHRGQKVQFELVAVLALLALFTHNHTFWVAGLLLALVPLPDFTTPLRSIAGSLDRIAGSAEASASTPPASKAKQLAADRPTDDPPADDLRADDHPMGKPTTERGA